MIRQLFDAPIDDTATRWRRRHLYTEEAWTEWAEWQPAHRSHADALDCGLLFSKPDYILSAPGLRSADREIQAEAWNTYRNTLIIDIRQALTVGFPWKQLLIRLHGTLAHHTLGYPRLANYVKTALTDKVLIRYPLLHADVLIFKLDSSFTSGSSKYTNDSTTAEWSRTTAREPGEDPISLAQRVIAAFLAIYAGKGLTEDDIWKDESHRQEVNQRMRDCLLNDESRGRAAALESTRRFVTLLETTKYKVEYECEDPSSLSCERIASLAVAPYEASMQAVIAHQPDDDEEQQVHWGRHTGAGSRERRLQRRAEARGESGP